MSFVVPRTCTEVATSALGHRETRPLADHRSRSAYVLLGDPGAGKTTAFNAEVDELGDQSLFISARDLITYSLEHHPEWKDRTLFIDGLDEVRVGSSDVRTPFDEIRARLDALGRPKFRLSCRSADWLGAIDRTKLDDVAPDGKVTVLNLDPLNDENISRILEGHHGFCGDPVAFIVEARERGIGGLLTNPQTLELVVETVVDGGGWPSSRRETFEIACARLAVEQNPEHSIVVRDIDVGRLADAAGRLCIVQLVAGVPGYASEQRRADEDYIDPNRSGYEDGDLLRRALTTNLFKVADAGGFQPIHRHIAEYVGAAHVAGLIEKGLPAKRVIALMTGEDGLVVSELRGLSAWLAANSKIARSTLIQLDPIGVGNYGDISGFSVDDKRSLLESLARQTSVPGYMFAASAFSDLAMHEFVPVFVEAMKSPDREAEHQSFVAFLLLTLTNSQPMPTLANALYEIVFDETWWPGVRHSALEVFARLCREGIGGRSKLEAILNAVRDGKLGDPDNELLGNLLTHMYPTHVPASKVLDFLHDGGDPRTIGSYLMFWKQRLIDESSDDQIAELLDNMVAKLSDLRPALERHLLYDLPLELLERGLIAHGDWMGTPELYDWLRMGSNSSWRRRGDGVRARIRSWLENRPDIQKSVLIEGLSRSVEPDDFRFHAYNVDRCLFGSDSPSDFGLWSLKQAVKQAYSNPMAAGHFLERAVSAHKTQLHNSGLSVDLLRDLTAEHEELKAKLDKLLAPEVLPDNHVYDDETEEFLRQSRQREEEWMDYVRSQREALLENRAPHMLLYQLAENYLGGIDRISGRPSVRGVEELLKNDLDLVAAGLRGLKRVIFRSDIPDIDDVLELRTRGRVHYVSFAVLAGMAELERTSPEQLDNLDENQIRKALTFYFNGPLGQVKPEWYLRMLQRHPEIVAGVQLRFAVSNFKSKESYVDGLWHLSNEQEHAPVARLVSLPLLRSFPARARLKHMEALENLLLAAIQHVDRQTLERLIDEKLQLKSLDVAQRARWLAAGLIVSPNKFLDAAEEFAGGSERRIRHLASLFQNRASVMPDAHAARLLVQLAGRSYGPDLLYEDGWRTPEIRGSEFVRDLLQRLAGTPDQDATNALEILAEDPGLLPWREIMLRSHESQRVVRRDATYRHPTVEQVADTLNRSTPANAADLAALIVDRFEMLNRRIRSGNTDDWRQYWNEDINGKPLTPKHEDHCRDALLSDLRLLLPDSVDAQPEGQYANDRRSDIRVTALAGFNVPVEIKKNNNRDLWTAIDDQLINRYASDPETRGYGIYLVFWFGRAYTQIGPDGSRPKDPTALREKLQDDLSYEHARKISVCVIDVDPGR